MAKIPGEAFACASCGQEFQRQNAYRDHREREHGNSRKLTARTCCGLQFSTEPAWLDHVGIEHGGSAPEG
jgi:hypothetical protein